MERTADRIMELRAARGWTIHELAKRAGVGVDTISHLERGNTKPHPRTVYKLAQAFEIPMGELLGKAPAPV
jgi:transcriptional regulator with XRE-family HTH domain